MAAKGATLKKEKAVDDGFNWNAYSGDALAAQIDITGGKIVDMTAIEKAFREKIKSHSQHVKETYIHTICKLAIEGTNYTRNRSKIAMGDGFVSFKECVEELVDSPSDSTNRKSRDPSELTVSRLARLGAPLALKAWVNLDASNKPFMNLFLMAKEMNVELKSEMPLFFSVMYLGPKFSKNENWVKAFLNFWAFFGWIQRGRKAPEADAKRVTMLKRCLQFYGIQDAPKIAPAKDNLEGAEVVDAKWVITIKAFAWSEKSVASLGIKTGFAAYD